MPARGRGSKRTGAAAPHPVNTAASFDPPAKRTRTSTPPATAPPPAAIGGKPDDGHMGQGASGRDTAALGEWNKGTSHSAWNCELPTSIETPDHLAVCCPLVTQQLIWEGGYMNLACFIAKEEGEELTTRL